MRASDIKTNIQEIRTILNAAGAVGVEEDFARLEDFITSQGDRDLDELYAEIVSKIDPALSRKRKIAYHLSALKSAGFDENAFLKSVESLKAERSFSKEDILSIAKDLGVIRISERSKASIVQSIEKHFYWALYNRDADEMAKRATPW